MENVKQSDTKNTHNNPATKSGLELMLAMIAGELPPPPICQPMGYTLTEASDGRAVFRGTPTKEYTNPMGTVHGGWYGTLLDSALACAVLTKIPAGSTYTTLEYKVNIVKPIPVGMEIEAIAETEHVGRSTGIASGRIVGVKDGRIYATGSTTCIIMKLNA